MLIFENQTTDGLSKKIISNGGVYQIQISGTFAGSEIIETLVSQEGLPAQSQSNGVKNAPTSYRIYLKAGSVLQLRLSGADPTTDITASVI